VRSSLSCPPGPRRDATTARSSTCSSSLLILLCRCWRTPPCWRTRVRGGPGPRRPPDGPPSPTPRTGGPTATPAAAADTAGLRHCLSVCVRRVWWLLVYVIQ
jgi:hypothetical protein